MSAAEHPAPPVNRDVAFLYEGYTRGELRVQQCGGCGVLRHPPSPFCSHCRSGEWSVIVAAGTGVLHSYTVHYHPPIPPWRTPLPIGIADMTEGFRFVASMPDADPDAIRIGARVHVVFYATGPDRCLPKLMLEETL